MCGDGGLADMKKLLIAVALLPAATAAHAQDNRDLRVRVGLGGQIRPDYIGSDEHVLAPLFKVDIAHGSDEFRFKAPDDNFGFALISKNGFSAGPAANIESSRKNSDVGAPVGKVSTTVEAGVFAQYLANDSFRVRGEVRKGIGGHDGLVGSIGADKIWRDGDKYMFSVGPRLMFSDARYQRAYFGVTPAVALATGLPSYRPSGGLHAAALASGLNYQLGSQFGVFGFARYDRLLGDAAKSPIVRVYGSRNQASGGIGLTYTFGIQR